ncbi:MAG: DUF2849 domain-containing protein [Hyphomicrobiales bacterium]
MKAITANELHVGNVLFLSKDGSWSGEFSKAAIFDAEGFDAALEAAQKDEASGLVIGVYEIDVEESAEGLRPSKFRERIRAEGPTVAYGEEMKLEGFYAA